ncbi:MAG: hypothetical protein K2Q12_07325 [Rickettsiales bacterium]|nr:hypothetical protein [Rickettsiales bacterium]
MAMEAAQLEKLAVEGILRREAAENLGVYAQQVIGGDGAHEVRTERMNGWNECVFAVEKNYATIKAWLDALPEEVKRSVTSLLIEGKVDLFVEDGQCGLHVNCNDLFGWGCADSEEVELDDLASFQECLTLVPKGGIDLWVCRKRQARPQGAVYSYYDKEHWPLFDACGPEREIGFGNPYKPGEYKSST